MRKGTEQAKRVWPVPAVFLLALLFRAIYLSEIVHLPDFEAPLVDAGYHDFCAWGTVSGEWKLPPGSADPLYESTPYFRPPLTTFFLAMVYALFGHSYLAARYVQILLGSLSCVLSYVLGRKLFNRPVGILAGLMSSAYWVFVYFDTEYREVSLLVFLIQSTLLAMINVRESPSYGRGFLTGALLGLAALAKPNVLLFLPFMMLWPILSKRETPSRKRDLIVMGVMCIGVLVIVLPVTVRNFVKGKDLVLVSSNGGINLLIGNNPKSTGFAVALPDYLPKFESAFDYPAVVKAVERREGRTLKHSEVSRIFLREGLDHIRENPETFLRMTGKKAAAFWSPAEIVSEKDLNLSRRESTLLSALPLRFDAVFALAALGLVLTVISWWKWRGGGDGRKAAPIAFPEAFAVIAFLLIYYLSFLPFFITGRYRAPVVPLLMVFSAYGLYWIAVSFRRGNVARGLLATGLALTVLLLSHVDQDVYRYDEAKGLYDRGTLYYQRGDIPEAEIYLRAALRIDPGYVRALNNLGLILRKEGRHSEAEQFFLKALAKNPRNTDSLYNLGLVALDRGDRVGWRSYIERAVDQRPNDAVLLTTIANDLVKHDLPDEAVGFYLSSLALSPDRHEVHFRLGRTYLGLKRYDEAIDSFQRAIALYPDYGEAHNNLGVAYALTGRKSLAVREFEQALRADPNNEGYRNNLNRVNRAEASGQR